MKNEEFIKPLFLNLGKVARMQFREVTSQNYIINLRTRWH